MIKDVLPMAWELSGQNFWLMVFVAWLIVGLYGLCGRDLF